MALKSLPSTSQFLHLSRYGKLPRPGAKPWENIAGIVGEAGRLPGCVAHLQTPGIFTLLEGITPADILGEALGLAETARDETGKRKLRSDGGVLVAGVVGWPGDPALLTGGESFIEKDIYTRWQGDVVGWLKSRFGPALRYALKHTDEPRPHIHFATLPSLNANMSLDWTWAHPGMKAKRAAAKLGKDKQEQEKAYRDALAALLDDLYNAVSRSWGHARVGPVRTRVTRMEAVAMRRIREKVEQVHLELERTRCETLAAAEAEGWHRYHTQRDEYERRITDLVARLEAAVLEIKSQRELIEGEALSPG
jgi:hypothetical protein